MLLTDSLRNMRGTDANFEMDITISTKNLLLCRVDYVVEKIISLVVFCNEYQFKTNADLTLA